MGWLYVPEPETEDCESQLSRGSQNMARGSWEPRYDRYSPWNTRNEQILAVVNAVLMGAKHLSHSLT